MVMSHRSRDFELKFTHGDLNFANILVSGDKVAAIVDWGISGWYPDYCEYARMRIDTLGPHCTPEYASQVLEAFEADTQLEDYRITHLELR